ncbi:MAG: spore maturation protein A [Oscillospiraceae bacterium]|jgi:spore maturation protein A|nr:spore maturation protein A [Oscillospiraceae bacterium]
MAMSVLLVVMMLVAVIYSLFAGTVSEMSAGLLGGAEQAVKLGITMAGVLCLWSGVVEVMRRAGLIKKLSDLLKFPLGALFPETRSDDSLRGDLAASVSANLLGLGNAATPLSIRACSRLHESAGRTGVASDSVCMLVILGAGSLQIIPATVAAARASLNAANPFDILPAVWFATAVSCATGILCGLLLRKLWR